MKIHFLKTDALEALRTNFAANKEHYTEKTNDWIYEYFGGESPFLEFRNPVGDFNLEVHKDCTMAQSDVRNAIAIYSAMKDLSDSQATDERLWSGLCHGDFWGYMNTRWYSDMNGNVKESDIKTRYFFANNRKRSLIKNALSKLWWIARLTYDSSRNDPFELTHYFDTDYATKGMIIFSNNYMGNATITRGLVSALIKLKKTVLSAWEREKFIMRQPNI